MAIDYRMNYLEKQIAAGEKFELSILGDCFMLTGDKGTAFKVRPIIPKKMVIPNLAEGTEMILTKDKFLVKVVKEKKTEQIKMPGMEAE